MKKILLFLGMFLFVFNVKALTFNVDITNIEDEGNNGTIGSITDIDVANKTIDAYFQDIGDEVSFSITVTNTGDRAGTLRSIGITSTNDKMEYTTSLPEGGLAINGNDTNGVLITAKVKAGAVKGTSSTEIKITYNYDEGSCPDGEILSDDESMCLCPEGMERNETGICVTPEKPVECAPGEIYNETKKICEKKVVPVNPSNPKTLDNIILITLLFVVSGLGIYAVMFKKLNTNKKKATAGIITGVVTLSLSFAVLASVFGLDNLLGAIVNPITKSKELVVTVNEEIDLIETWDGDCDVTGALTPDNVFEGGSGTESDPYTIKTANQLACFAKSVNEGETYEGKFIKQIKNIKLNDNLNENITAGTTDGLHVWTSAGYRYWDSDTGERFVKTFAGTYDGDNKIINGLYVTGASAPNVNSYKGLFGDATNATFKNIKLSDVYMNTAGSTGALLGYGYENLTLDNITTYGNAVYNGWDGSGIVSNYGGNGIGELKIENTTNNVNLTCTASCSGIIHRMESFKTSDEPTAIFNNDTNNGNITFSDGYFSGFGGLFGYISGGRTSINNAVNTGVLRNNTGNGSSQFGGIVGYASGQSLTINNSHNTGNIEGFDHSGQFGGLLGAMYSSSVTIDDCYNSGNITSENYLENYHGNSSDQAGGIIGYVSNSLTITDSYNTGNMEGSYAYAAGLVGVAEGGTMEDCYNTGDITAASYVGGLASNFRGDIRRSYNTGKITLYGTVRAGGLVGWGNANIYDSYNTGDIFVTSHGGQHGGLCADDCRTIKNSYNRGNITVSYYGTDIGGITGMDADISNCYNSGTITYLDSDPEGSTVYAGGISADPRSVTNSYNLGDIIINQNGGSGAIEVGGISTFKTINNSVNKGNITIKINAPYSGRKSFYLAGISAINGANNSFNAGTISFDDDALGHSIYDDTFPDPWNNDQPTPHYIALGQICFDKTENGNNKFNTDPNGFAIPSLLYTAEESLTTGSYTTEEEPSILSIINGDDAFNSELDENGLPTLKAFN